MSGTVGITPPVGGLAALGTESRVLATPWSRMVRGIGLGQHPVGHDAAAADRIRHTFAALAGRGVEEGDPYGRFARLLVELALDHARDGAVEPARMSAVLAAAREHPNPYFRVMAGCVAADAFGKLGLGGQLARLPGADPAAELLAAVEGIEADRIRDENAGRHGHYERLSASSAVLLALGQLGATVEPGRLLGALDLLDGVPSPFFRGRGGSVLLAAAMLLGREDLLTEGGRDRIAETLRYLGHTGPGVTAPVFPQPMSPAFVEVYPLLTMLNAVSMSRRSGDYLRLGEDRLAQARALMGALRPVERTHMGLYYVVALHNLGVLDEQVPDLDRFAEDLVGQWRTTPPGENYFLNGISYAYLIQTAVFTGRPDLVTEEFLDRYVDSFPDLDRTDDDRVNRPYPFAYAFNALAEIGCDDLLFQPRRAYGGAAPVDWVVSRLSPGARAEPRLYMLHHALISYALRMREPAPEAPVFRDFVFPASH
ncbi:hypothetical protein [Actinokineospora globicatena]|uniref:hypothetical protein n=1 Tax=Actinokineospora globicatena TaxID=103729 RepID=UPI0020A25D51|nr:hypothetical protein [Actinokineospora globicatena]MCP2305948.1 hypothetical protein [Actinokineospora globicatena]GLW80182.1 hypothetical protein Aglo01_46630 [Actinokineospora globicatena]GLW87011.1 hypothetical protein Aglo02_46500 [Actinokineospora globicatena]